MNSGGGRNSSTYSRATKVVTFMKGLRNGPVKTYLFREYPSTLEAAITLAMQEGFSLRQAKLHANVPRSQPRPVVSTGGPEPMDLSNATAAGQQQHGSNVRCFRCGRIDHFARECTAPVHYNGGRRGDAGHRREQTKNLPRSLLEVRLAADAIVKTEKRVMNVRFSYKQRVFVEHFIALELDDKFDVVTGMPWLARHDPVIDWKKRTLMRFGRNSGIESDGPVTAAHAPVGARGSPVETALNAVPERPGSARGAYTLTA
ncbi:hypothetical protein ON010_g16555 [Phytophthora cinnamomi]|nr:hypothetical protein ON010_g16555 [Phytophthora cinnamomi]